MNTIDRRMFLEGLGTAMAVPALAALVPRRALAEPQPPQRFLAFYVPNGMHMPAWTPAAEGPDFALSPILQPLEPVKDDVLVLSGLQNRAAGWPGVGPHGSATAAFLTNTNPFTEASDHIRNATSLDQVLAQAVGRHTPFRSLQLGIDGGAATGICDSGDSCAYTRNISWADENSPLAKEVNPVAMFDRLFEGRDPRVSAEEARKRRHYRTSVLDYVADSARRLDGRLGAEDRERLDDYMTGVRELEVRLQSLDAATAQCSAERPAAEDFHGKIAAMMDLMVLAFRCDLTRVITFMLGNAASNRVYGFLGIDDPHHDLSHHQGDPARLEKLQAINTWEVTRLAALLQRLRNVPEGDGTLLDHTLVYFASEISDGDAHSLRHLPIVIGGRGGGAVSPGRHVVFPDEPSVGDLYVAFLRAFGVNRSSFGDDGRRPLPGLA